MWQQERVLHVPGSPDCSLHKFSLIINLITSDPHMRYLRLVITLYTLVKKNVHDQERFHCGSTDANLVFWSVCIHEVK